MKIEGSNKAGSARGASKADAKKKTGDSAFSSMVDESASAESVAQVSGSVSISQLDALLSMQEAESGTSEEATKKAKKRAVALLEELDKVRMGILTGGIPKSAIQHLTHMIGAHRETVIDPVLGEILDEIDLRAQVELAKHNR